MCLFIDSYISSSKFRCSDYSSYFDEERVENFIDRCLECHCLAEAGPAGEEEGTTGDAAAVTSIHPAAAMRQQPR